MWQLSNIGSQHGRVPVRFVRCVVARSAEHGIDADMLLHSSGIDPALLHAADARVPVASYARLEMLTMQTMRDESLGYAPRVHRLGGWSTACYAALHPGTLGQSLGRLLRCYSLFDWGQEMRLDIDGMGACISMQADTGAAYQAFAYERSLSTIYRLACWLLDEDLPLKSVEFQHASPSAVDDYRWLFASGSLLFDRPRTLMRFDRLLLDKPIRQDHRSLDALLHDAPLNLLKPQRATADWTTRLRERVARNLPQLPEFDDVAGQLELHPQTLRRRLATEGITYKQIKDQVRRDAAEYYLRQRSHSIEEVAFRCGFSEASALIRAFKRWNGMTPHAYAEMRPRRRENQPVGMPLSA
ncbi:MAG: AraC family transcriptional regulator [Hydrocarboniphaga sp.]|uniref:AraC family transcriptional regulator n=1 Tax=Hydrocarboniphaga sp. TaxID=2033016 RepID=UPI00261F6AA3|nr:AraC family transcriptional regulator [Hydrocarboniphaga sp.]MDB5970149.1 AraC family transcriptional regulator [Hydrocarboniphaga sp.]